jgi:carbon starvation protein
MAFSTFVFDTLDVATRLGRYLVQELTGWRGLGGALAGTLLTIVPAVLFIAFGGEGSYLRYWTLFGASNQLLAALSLAAMGVWLRQEGRRSAFVLLPAAFVTTITLWSLGSIAIANLRGASASGLALANAIAALTLLGLALFLLAHSLRAIRCQSHFRQ